MTSDKSNFNTSDAIERGDVEAIERRILSDPQYVHGRDEDDDTPILLAVCSSKLDIAELLLQHGANPNDCSDDGYSCLLMAAESDKPESMAMLRLLLSAGADVLATGINGWAPLHMAASHGHAEKAKLFINAGAEVDQRTEIDGGFTPLMEAAGRGRAGVVQLLLEHGADASLRNHMSRKSPIEMAQRGLQGPDPAVEALFKQRAKLAWESMGRQLTDRLPPETIELMKERIEMAKQTNRLLNPEKDSRDYTEVIRILSEFTDKRVENDPEA